MKENKCTKWSWCKTIVILHDWPSKIDFFSYSIVVIFIWLWYIFDCGHLIQIINAKANWQVKRRLTCFTSAGAVESVSVTSWIGARLRLSFEVKLPDSCSPPRLTSSFCLSSPPSVAVQPLVPSARLPQLRPNRWGGGRSKQGWPTGVEPQLRNCRMQTNLRALHAFLSALLMLSIATLLNFCGCNISTHHVRDVTCYFRSQRVRLLLYVYLYVCHLHWSY